MFFVCRQSTSKELQRLQHQTSQMESGILSSGGDLLDRVQIPNDSEIFKRADGPNAGTSINSANGELDLGNLDLSQMDPEVIRVSRSSSLIRNVELYNKCVKSKTHSCTD